MRKNISSNAIFYNEKSFVQSDENNNKCNEDKEIATSTVKPRKKLTKINNLSSSSTKPNECGSVSSNFLIKKKYFVF